LTVKIVTDSTADLPAELINELGITVVPLYVRFGETVYRDRVEISEDEFVRALRSATLTSKFYPVLGGDGRGIIVQTILDAVARKTLHQRLYSHTRQRQQTQSRYVRI